MGVPHTYSRILLAITTTGLTERNRKDVGKGFARVKKKEEEEKRREEKNPGEERRDGRTKLFDLSFSLLFQVYVKFFF